MQCKDIPELPTLQFLITTHEVTIVDKDGTTETFTPAWKTWNRPGSDHDWPHAVEHAMPPGTPWKLVVAKMKQMIRKGLVDGCCCGCRGDFEITEKGEKVLAEMDERENNGGDP